jgi:hypothetical protein
MEVSGELHAPAALPPGERTFFTHSTGGWIGPKTGMDIMENRNNLCLCRESKPSRPALSMLLYGLKYPSSFVDVGRKVILKRILHMAPTGLIWMQGQVACC